LRWFFLFSIVLWQFWWEFKIGHSVTYSERKRRRARVILRHIATFINSMQTYVPLYFAHFSLVLIIWTYSTVQVLQVYQEPSIYYLRDWGGWVQKMVIFANVQGDPSLVLYSSDIVAWVSLKSPKMYWRNIWMNPIRKN
jgi:hypothetical protein